MGLDAGFIHNPTRSGIVVTEQTALQVSAVWAAVNCISQSIGSFPLITYQKQPNNGRIRAETHPLFHVLNEQPNTEMPRPVWFETVMGHALLYGTAFAEIVRDGAGNPIELYPIHPEYVAPIRDTTTGYLTYRVYQPAGTPHYHNSIMLDPADILVVPGLGCDGSVGYNILRVARETIGYSLGCDRFGANLWSNMAKLGGTLETPNRLSDEGRDNLRKSFNAAYAGVDNAGKTAVLEEGLKYTPFTFANESGLYNESRAFQIAEVARYFNISPTKLFDFGAATWGNLDVLNRDYCQTTLMPWLNKWENEIQKKLFGFGSDFYCEFLTDSLLRGDPTVRYAAYNVGLTAGFLTVDEVRQYENLPPLPKPKPDPTPPPEEDVNGNPNE